MAKKKTTPAEGPGSRRKWCGDMALLMAANCVRNTVIETYHGRGSISDAEMEAFNREVADKLYTFLLHMFGEEGEEADRFFRGAWLQYPRDWGRPKVARRFRWAMKELADLFPPRGGGEAETDEGGT
jgi:hypothetical protein